MHTHTHTHTHTEHQVDGIFFAPARTQNNATLQLLLVTHISLNVFNPFSTMFATPSLGKQPVKAQCEIIKVIFRHFARACERTSIELHTTESIGPSKYCQQACICALFSLEILQDGAVKG